MIKKFYELDKFDLSKYNFFLIYGKNEGLQTEIINKYFYKKELKIVDKYDEFEFLENYNNILDGILSKSLFENEKTLIISRATDKIFKLISEIFDKNISSTKIIIKSLSLDKKSKLRNLFEKSKNLVTIPVYEDTDNNLANVVINYLSKKKIKLSRESINLLVRRANGDRKNIQSELEKIYNYSITNSNIGHETVQKLTNLAENYSATVLADSYLTKNKKDILKIFNENNYSDEDCILILRTLLSKSKRLMYILKKNKETNSLDMAISSIKPPIFWKEKESVKSQVNKWVLSDLKKKIYQINEMEMLVKKNSKNSLNLISDFMVNY